MRSLIPAFLFAALFAAGCGRSGPPASTDTGAEQSKLSEASTTNEVIVYSHRTVSEVSMTNGGIVYTHSDTTSGPDLAAAYNSVHDGEKAQAAFSGGDGSSIKDAVVITAANEEAGYRAAYIWSREHYPGSRLEDESSDYDDNGRFWTELKIVTADGKTRTLFFETTSFFGQ